MYVAALWPLPNGCPWDTANLSCPYLLGLPDLGIKQNKQQANTAPLQPPIKPDVEREEVKFELQIVHGRGLNQKRLFVVYLRFIFNWVSCISSGNLLFVSLSYLLFSFTQRVNDNFIIYLFRPQTLESLLILFSHIPCSVSMSHFGATFKIFSESGHFSPTLVILKPYIISFLHYCSSLTTGHPASTLALIHLLLTAPPRGSCLFLFKMLHWLLAHSGWPPMASGWPVRPWVSWSSQASSGLGLPSRCLSALLLPDFTNSLAAQAAHTESSSASGLCLCLSFCLAHLPLAGLGLASSLAFPDLPI